MGHFSRFLPRGSVIVDCVNNTETDLKFTAAVTPQNQLVVVVLNTDNNGRTMPTVEYEVEVANGVSINMPKLPGHGVHTLVVSLDGVDGKQVP